MRTNARLIVLLLLTALFSNGCYYAHLASGQTRLLLARRPIDEVLEDPATPAKVRSQLELVREAREFARGLGLTVEGQYTSYAEWPGDRVVTNVVATRPGEVEPAEFRFPIVGRVPYKGFFDLERAEEEAKRLRAEDLDVCLIPVRAYSTLGWFDDPVTDPMLQLGSAGLVETLLHELVHATVFTPGEAQFNEGVATFLGEEASLRFFAERNGPESSTLLMQRHRIEDERTLAAALMGLREAVAELYRSEPAGPERIEARAELERGTREQVAALSLHESDAPRVAAKLRLGDACLALVGTYQSDVPRYGSRLAAFEGDLPRFISEAKRAAATEDPRESLLGETRGDSGDPDLRAP